METKRYINSTHNENCRQVFVQPKDVRSLMADFFSDAEDAVFQDDTSEPMPPQAEKPPVELPPMDERIRQALRTVTDEGLIRHSYDYHVIMQVLNEWFNVVFRNAQGFVNFLGSLGVTHRFPRADSLNKKLAAMRGSFPEWSWTDADHTEANRRINIARRFVKVMR